MRNKLLLVLAPFSFVFLALTANLFNKHEMVYAQENPTVATAVALTLTALITPTPSFTPTLTIDEQIRATVQVRARSTVRIENSYAQTNSLDDWNRRLPPEIQAADRASAVFVVTIEAKETAGSVRVSGCPGGKIDLVKIDYTITLNDTRNQAVKTIFLEGNMPGVGFLVTSCAKRYGPPRFEEFFHWLAPLVYVFATPTFTATFTPTPTRTPLPTATPPTLTSDTPEAVAGSNEGDLSDVRADIWKYKGVAGEVISIRTESREPGALTILTVYDNNGKELVRPQPNLPIENLLLPTSSEYAIVVRPFTAIQGRYTLIIKSNKK